MFTYCRIIAQEILVVVQGIIAVVLQFYMRDDRVITFELKAGRAAHFPVILCRIALASAGVNRTCKKPPSGVQASQDACNL